MGRAAPETFLERLRGASRANDSLLCVGLDPDLSRFPPSLRSEPDITRAIVSFNETVIAATAHLVCAYKPNLGFYAAYGTAGLAALEATRQCIPAHIPVILDAKVGDMENTAAAYATGYFQTWGFDAVTVNPYLGEDSLRPFLRHGDKGVIVICKTSNPGSGDLQDLPTRSDGPRRGASQEQPLYLAVADRVAAWAERWPATLGLVVGATYPTELAAVRKRCPDQPILLPGVGAQAGDLEASVRAGLDASGGGLLVSASRSIIYARPGPDGDWAAAATEAAGTMRAAINSVRAAVVER